MSSKRDPVGGNPLWLPKHPLAAQLQTRTCEVALSHQHCNKETVYELGAGVAQSMVGMSLLCFGQIGHKQYLQRKQFCF